MAYLEKHPSILNNLINKCSNLSICEIISRLIRADKPFAHEDYFNQEIYFFVIYIKKNLSIIK